MVVFIRKNGRVIPITSRAPGNKQASASKPLSKKAEGAALIATGVGISAGTGFVASGLVKEAARVENIARNLGVRYHQIKSLAMTAPTAAAGAALNGERLRVGRAAVINLARSKGLFNASLNVRTFGHLIGSAAIGAGVTEMVKGTKWGKEHQKTAYAIGLGSTEAAHIAIRSGFLKGMGFKAANAVRTAAVQLAKSRLMGL